MQFEGKRLHAHTLVSFCRIVARGASSSEDMTMRTDVTRAIALPPLRSPAGQRAGGSLVADPIARSGPPII
jgi:hypothetical protein